MIINSARFAISNSTHKKCPSDMRHEYAFIGRSKLAKTSSTPGKTMLINHFLVNDEWYIVDLPGYGFAQRGKEQREQLEKMIRGYILEREQMTNLFVLIDSRHEPMKIDLEFFDWLGENGVPFAIVFTKLDKLGNDAGRRNVQKYCKSLLESWEELPPIFLTSSEDGRDRQELLDYIEQLNRLPVGATDEGE